MKSIRYSSLALVLAALPASAERAEVSGVDQKAVSAERKDNREDARTVLGEFGSHRGFGTTFEGEVRFSFRMRYGNFDRTRDNFGGVSFQSGGREVLGIGNRWKSSMWGLFFPAVDFKDRAGKPMPIEVDRELPVRGRIRFAASAPDTLTVVFGDSREIELAGDFGFDEVKVRQGNAGCTTSFDVTEFTLAADGRKIHPLGNFDREGVPEPVLPAEDAGLLALYWKAWELAWDHVALGEGLPVSPYMDEAFDPGRIWIWDTAFMTFFTRYAPARFPGVQSLRNFYEPMHRAGERPFVIQHPDNPPLFAWSEYANWQLNGVCSEGEATPANLAKVVASLTAHYEWFEKIEPGFHMGGQRTALKAVRDPDGGLLGFQWNGVASGMDNTPRTRGGAGMLWLDAIAQHGLSALYLSRLSQAAGMTAESREWAGCYEAITRTVNRHYWSAEAGCYSDIVPDGRGGYRTTGIKSPAAFWPVLAEMADAERAGKMAELVRDPAVFGGDIPFPSIARNDPDFTRPDGNYWRGGVWLPTAYLAIKALETSGHGELADRTAEQLVAHMLRTYREFSPPTIWECYSPTRPQPANHGGSQVRPDFCGWSALGPISLLIENVLGFHTVDAAQRIVKWRLHRKGPHGIRRLRFGAVTADILTDGKGRIRVTSNEPFVLHVHDRVFQVKAGTQTFPTHAEDSGTPE